MITLAMWVGAIIAAIAAFSTPAHPCGKIEKEFMYCYLFPMNAFDTFGLLLILLGLVYNSFLWIKYHDDAGDKLITNIAGFLAIIVGLFTIYLVN